MAQPGRNEKPFTTTLWEKVVVWLVLGALAGIVWLQFDQRKTGQETHDTVTKNTQILKDWEKPVQAINENSRRIDGLEYRVGNLEHWRDKHPTHSSGEQHP